MELAAIFIDIGVAVPEDAQGSGHDEMRIP